MFEELTTKLQTIGIAPVLFIGAGISRRYANTPNWIELLEKTAESLDINFEKLKQKHTNHNNEINYVMLGDELENLYFEQLPEDSIEKGRNKSFYYKKNISDILNNIWDINKSKIAQNKEIQSFKNISPSAIITTNYDPLLEYLFENYQVHIGQQSLLSNVVDGIGDIYKIHGCISKPESIVIDRQDYKNFTKYSTYLNAKILTLFLEYPIIFMGYSISDINVKNILITIIEMLPKNKVDELNNRIWFLNRKEIGRESYSQKTRINLDEYKYLDINSYYLDDFSAFYNAIGDIKNKRLPIKFLKYLKNNVYKLAASQKYDEKLINVNLVDLEKIDDYSKLTNIAGLSFSIEKSKKTQIDFIDICNGFLEEKFNEFEPIIVVDFQLANAKMVPIFWALRKLDEINIKNSLNSKIVTKARKDDFLKRLNEDTDYCSGINIGGDKRNYIFNDIPEILSKESIDEYMNLYVSEYNKKHPLNKINGNQKGPVIRRFFLKLLKDDIKTLKSNKNVILEYSEEILKSISGLSQEYIINNKKDIFVIVKTLVKENNTLSYRKVLSYIDWCIYYDEKLKIYT